MLLVAVALLLVPAAADATPYTVTDSGDSGPGTLRQAIMDANGNPGADTITISIANPPNTLTLSSALPAISDDVTIAGPGQSQFTVNGGFVVQPFQVDSGKNVTISDLTVTQGACFDATCGNSGGAIHNQGNLTLDRVTVTQSITLSSGGGIFNSGTLTLNNSLVTANGVNVSGGTNPSYQGGGIYNSGTLDVVLSTISNNQVAASGYTAQGNATGGGIFNTDAGSVTIDRSTVSGNSASADGGTATNVNGGGIFNRHNLAITSSTISGNVANGAHGSSSNGAHGGGIGNVNPSNASDVTVTLDRTTLSDNLATVNPSGTSQGGGLLAFAGTYTITSSTIVHNQADFGTNLTAPSSVHVGNTIVAYAQGPESCSGPLTSDGYNISDDATCGLTTPTDQESTDPNLDQVAGLSDNGGPTKTWAILAPSPAIDQGLSSAGETVDQRGMPRPSDFGDIENASGGDGTDVGAFEVQDTVPPDTVLDSGPSGTINDPTPTFTFHATEAHSTFQCKVDSHSYAACASPRTLAHLADGSHTFTVRARDPAGNFDATPPSRSFAVKTAEVARSGSTLVITAAPPAKDNLKITRPSASTLRVTDLPAGAFSGSGIHVGAGCTRSGDYTANCGAASVTSIRLSSGAATDRVINSTSVPSSINGGAASDSLVGGSGADTITGGPAADVLQGGNGNDVLFARDLTSDSVIDCDGGSKPGTADKADLDLLPKDPNSIVAGCETKSRH